MVNTHFGSCRVWHDASDASRASEQEQQLLGFDQRAKYNTNTILFFGGTFFYLDTHFIRPKYNVLF